LLEARLERALARDLGDFDDDRVARRAIDFRGRVRAGVDRDAFFALDRLDLVSPFSRPTLLFSFPRGIDFPPFPAALPC
jgi:hypothetical protein